MGDVKPAFNAWTDPWLPVQADMDVRTVSLRDAYVNAHQLTGLGPGLTPLDLDSLYRFLPAVGALIARGLTAHEQHHLDRQFPKDAVDRFGVRWADRFDLTGERPFCQRWDRNQHDLASLPNTKPAQPMIQLHPHEPGDKSSQWAVRRGANPTTSWPETTLLLITAWFQSLYGNGQDPWGGKMSKGSSATWHSSPMALHYTHPTSLLLTILANTPLEWLKGEDVPVFFDHGEPPVDEASCTESVARFTYSKSIPLIKVDKELPVAFVIGPDSTIPVPKLGKDEKESLGLVHSHDHTRLYVADGKKGIKPRGSLRARLTTTEGMSEWVKSERGVAAAVRRWESVERVIRVTDESRTDWQLSVLTDVGDGKGNRQWAAWDTVPLAFAAPNPILHRQLQQLLGLASDLRSKYLFAGRIAVGDIGIRGIPGSVEIGQAGFYSSIHTDLLHFIEDVTNGNEVEPSATARVVLGKAIEGFKAATRPLLTPRQAPAIARARAEYRRAAFKAFNLLFPDQQIRKEIV